MKILKSKATNVATTSGQYSIKRNQLTLTSSFFLRKVTPTLLGALLAISTTTSDSMGAGFGIEGGYIDLTDDIFYLENDPGETGEYRTTQFEYAKDTNELEGFIEIFPPGTEFQGNVTYPVADYGQQGPWPLIVLLHGRHETVFRARRDDEDTVNAPVAGDADFIFDITNTHPRDPKWRSGYVWPPTDGFQAIPNYQGHNRLAKHLASHGFVVANISANGLAPHDFQNNQARERGQLLRALLMATHMNFIEAASNGEELDDQLTGKIDWQAGVGLFGHSKGAEAALLAAQFINDAEDDLKIGAVFSLAPTLNLLPAALPDVPIGIMVGYADGDTGMLGIPQYEGALNRANYRTNDDNPDTAPKHLIVAMGANHNYFNEVWIPGRGFEAATNDDVFTHPANGGIGLQNCFTKPLPGSPGPKHFSQNQPGQANLKSVRSGRLSAEKQLDVGNAYVAGFFETYLKNDPTSINVLTGADIYPFASLELQPQDILVNYTPPDMADQSLMINPFDSRSHANISPTFGTGVEIENLLNVIRGGPLELSNENNGGENGQFMLNFNQVIDSSGQPLNPNPSLEPHSRGFGRVGAGALRVLSQDQPGSITHSFPDRYKDISQYDAVQFRLGTHFENKITTVAGSEQLCESRVLRNDTGLWRVDADAQVFVRLTDISGRSQRISADTYSAALLIPPGLPQAARLIMNQVRIPVSHFNEIDITNIQELVLEVGPDNEVQFSDLALTALPEVLK